MGSISGTVIVIYLAIVVLMIVAMWKVFTKAGEPGWACIIPIYSTIVMLKIVGKPWCRTEDYRQAMVVAVVNVYSYYRLYLGNNANTLFS